MAASPQDVQTSIEDQDDSSTTDPDSLIRSNDPLHPANHISDLCRRFYTLGWVTGTGGGVSIRHGNHIFLAPSGVQKEMMRPTDMFVMDFQTKQYVRRPRWAVLVTLICEAGLPNSAERNVFAIKEIEQIKGISRGGSGSDEIAEGGRKVGNLGYYDTMKIPIIENEAHEEDLTGALEKAIEEWPETCAVLVRRHGVYVWGRDVAQAKTQAESLDYLFQLAVEMHKLGLKWV
ncbi:Methylthioribulose-1-phosphate dehydratase [Friedmanniomyces endolithicus]|nr:Methylthioribulose-1-phosphate dehydratase [Friedmanniomyces endolithicus]